MEIAKVYIYAHDKPKSDLYQMQRGSTLLLLFGERVGEQGHAGKMAVAERSSAVFQS